MFPDLNRPEMERANGAIYQREFTQGGVQVKGIEEENKKSC